MSDELAKGTAVAIQFVTDFGRREVEMRIALSNNTTAILRLPEGFVVELRDEINALLAECPEILSWAKSQRTRKN